MNENVYNNPALGMTITLPGRWELLPRKATQSSTQSSPPSDCGGPLCGDPAIDLIIASKNDSSSAYRIFLAGYKLAPQYLDRRRNPLSKFAEMMMSGSLNGSGLVAIGTQTAVKLEGKPGYRLLAGKPGEDVANQLGYVSEVNGYVFLLVGSASASPQVLQSAIEGMKLGTLTH